MAIAITTLMENTISEHKGLLCEHGLSFHVRTPNKRFLLDCGSGAGLLHNAALLKIDLTELDFVALSHSHYDHGNGFRHVAGLGGVKTLITGRGYFMPKYDLKGFRHSYLGVDFGPDFLAEQGIAHRECGDLLEIDDGCWLLGNCERVTPEETIPDTFKLLRDGAFVPDLFSEEISLAMRMEDGLALLVGCSHPGVLNIARTVTKRLGLPIRGVWGGTHLHDASQERMAMTLAELKKLGVRYMGLSHCSGDAILEMIARDPDVEGCRLRAGDGVFL